MFGPGRARRITVTGWLVVLLAAPAAQADWGQVARARALYNVGRFDEAIAEAEGAAGPDADAALSTAAAIVLARARLERFRRQGDARDHDRALQTLQAVSPATLDSRTRAEWEVGVAEALFLGDQPGPAAELFGRLLAGSPGVDVGSQQRILHWWASAVEREAESQPPETRVAAYRRIVARMDDELATAPRTAAATYWLAAAALGAGDLERAWNAVVVGWINADDTPDGRALRADLNRLMLEGIIPDRARRQTATDSDRPETVDAMAELAAVWEDVKRRW